MMARAPKMQRMERTKGSGKPCGESGSLDTIVGKTTAIVFFSLALAFERISASRERLAFLARHEVYQDVPVGSTIRTVDRFCPHAA
jgi:hypothetical protein